MDYAFMLLRREDSKNKLMRMTSLFKVHPCLELIDVSKIEACCVDLETDCTIKRTKEKLPEMIEGVFGPMIRNVMSIDGSESLNITDPVTYLEMTKTSTFKNNKNKYCWVLDRHIYFPDSQWEAAAVDGMFEKNLADQICGGDPCIARQDQEMPVPDYLFAEIKQMVKQDLGMGIQIPSDNSTDKQSIQR